MENTAEIITKEYFMNFFVGRLEVLNKGMLVGDFVADKRTTYWRPINAEEPSHRICNDVMMSHYVPAIFTIFR